MINWGISSAGRAVALQAIGQRFDPVILHQEQRVGYITQYESQGTAVNPWASNSTYNNVTGSSDLLTDQPQKLCPLNMLTGMY